MFEVSLDNYTGPLDVLLRMIEDKKLPIHEVSLASVADSFLSYVREYAHSKPAVSQITYYLVVAATLVLVKSRSLLPSIPLTAEEEQSIEELELQLKFLKIFKEGGKEMGKVWGTDMLHMRARRVAIPVFAPHAQITSAYLAESFQNSLKEIPKAETLPTQTIRPVVHLHDVMDAISLKINSKTKFTFFDFVSELIVRFKDRMDTGAKKSAVVVSFLAILEMVRNGQLSAAQDGDEILVAPEEKPRV